MATGGGGGGGSYYYWNWQASAITPVRIKRARKRLRRAVVAYVPLVQPAPRHAGIAPTAKQYARRQRKRKAKIVRSGPPIPYLPRRVAGIAPKVQIFRRRVPKRKARRVNAFFPRTPSAAYSGYTVLLYAGPFADLPALRFRTLGYTIDTRQVFVGDGSTNHFVGGMRSSAPASSTAQGYPGEYFNDGTYEYRCYATNQWVRWAVSAF